MLQAGTGFWIAYKLSSDEKNEHEFTRLIGLYIVFRENLWFLRLPDIIREMSSMESYANTQDFYITMIYSISTYVITIVFLYASIKLLRDQTDTDLFLFLTIIPLMHFVRYLGGEIRWILRVIENLQYVTAPSGLLYYVLSLAVFLLVLLFILSSWFCLWSWQVKCEHGAVMKVV